MKDKDWYVAEYELDVPLQHKKNVECDYNTKDDKYFYNVSGFTLKSVFLVFDVFENIILGFYSCAEALMHFVSLNPEMLKGDWNIVEYNINELVPPCEFDYILDKDEDETE